ncbi:MAG: archease [Nitrososphaerota archaeon]|nr:archease [Candidatus Bathyarchaeota archaeon]MDW8048215.1 archease [Nitrososphaerota archaeon]
MDGEKRFEFLDHMADAYIAAYGKDLAEAFENAALAMFETMTDTACVKKEVEESVEIMGQDKESLLYNWLEDLLIRFEVTGMLYSVFKVESIERWKEGYRLKARIYGEPFNPEVHKQKVGIKAVTYHRMEIEESPGRTTVKFLLDL